MASVTMAQVAHTDDLVPSRPHRHLGVIPQPIADSSPVAVASIQVMDSSDNIFKVGSVIKIHYSFQNRSDHQITYSEGSRTGSYFHAPVTLDVRDENGNLPPETPFGCDFHFFSPCHTAPHLARLPVPVRFPSGAKREGEIWLSAQYTLAPGKYTAIAYICGMSEGPECFKTNTITITVEQRQSAGE